jgi:hypothetical protein
MLKYIAGIVLVFGLAVYVSVQDKRSAQQAAQETTSADKGALSAEANENHPQQNASNSEGNAPSWYLYLSPFFRWPDGPTTWVIVLTLLAIAEQAKESTKATQAMQAQVSMQMETLRPRLTVGFDGSQFKPMTEGRAARMVAKIINTGGTPAYHVAAVSWIEFLPMPFPQFTQAAEYFKGDSFPVYPTQPIFYPVMRRERLTESEIKATFKATHCLCLRLRLSYESFGKPKFSDFVFGAEPNGVATLKSDAD